MIYLDAAATTPVRRAVLETCWPYLTGEFGNPSSHHAVGASAAEALDGARRSVASALGARASDVVFTGSGTEADNLAVKGLALAADPARRTIVTARTDHAAVLESCRYLEHVHGFTIAYAPQDDAGLVDLEALDRMITDETALVSIALANNEIGTIQPVAEIARMAHASGALVHTDAVQAAGSVPIGMADLGVDALSVSGHKLGAPKGIGALLVLTQVPLEPVLHGGGQERGRRSGTENVAGAVALAAGLALAGPDIAAVDEVAARRDAFIGAVLATVPDAVLTGHPSKRLPGSASFCFPGTSGESVLVRLEESGVVCSSGSACAAGSDEPSHVLTALGFDRETAQTAVRFSFGTQVSADELAEAADRVGDAVRAVSALAG
ncbi:cysteine desulfurase family protein [Spelaeicoccus albus]|uniref:cysteine desulfurase n=1 Tax=Spelaeicoccus albus TaxID=1280376 RepID=A0A7Z0D0W9_9MICO|nr:cysteine desulfurase family protein [Spelaeicoccus albus]NYI65978.1 cysteine desulfurase [Spelaeicoccus albus]